MALKILRAKADSETSSSGMWDVFVDSHTGREDKRFLCGNDSDFIFERDRPTPTGIYLEHVLVAHELSRPQDHSHISSWREHWIASDYRILKEFGLGVGLYPVELGEPDELKSVSCVYLHEAVEHLSLAAVAWSAVDFEQSSFPVPLPRLPSISPDVEHALGSELSDFLPRNILIQLTELAQESFDSIHAISFTMEEDPEIPDYRKIGMMIDLAGSVEEVSEQYDTYTDSFVEKFPPDICRWITTGLNIV